jgi:hypothetical protein
MIGKRKRWAALAAIVLNMGATGASLAQSYPSKPIWHSPATRATERTRFTTCNSEARP